MQEREPEDGTDTSPDGDRTAHVMRVIREEPLLWPVAVVTWLVCSTFGASILIEALRRRGILAGCALLVAIFGTVYGLDADIRARRLRLRSRVVLSVWLGSALAAFGLGWLGAL